MENETSHEHARDPLTVLSLDELQHTVHDGVVVLLFRSPDCERCASLEPNLQDLLASRYPRIHYRRVDLSRHPEIAEKLGVASTPTVLAWFDGRETVRLSQDVSARQLDRALERPYKLMFGGLQG